MPPFIQSPYPHPHSYAQEPKGNGPHIYTTTMNTENHQQQHPFTIISDMYPILCTSQVITPKQGEAKQKRRRRRKAKNDDGEGAGKKRKLSEEQVNMLESSFGCEHKLESKRKDELASELGLDPRQVAVWFQNRRARWKNKRLEEEYSKLRAMHDNAVLEKCTLETEMLKLKDQLEEAQREIKGLMMSERGEIAISSNSPSSSMTTMEAIPHPSMMQLQGEYSQLGGYHCTTPLYLQEESCIPSALWSLYSM